MKNYWLLKDKPLEFYATGSALSADIAPHEWYNIIQNDDIFEVYKSGFIYERSLSLEDALNRANLFHNKSYQIRPSANLEFDILPNADSMSPFSFQALIEHRGKNFNYSISTFHPSTSVRCNKYTVDYITCLGVDATKGFDTLYDAIDFIKEKEGL